MKQETEITNQQIFEAMVLNYYHIIQKLSIINKSDVNVFKGFISFAQRHPDIFKSIDFNEQCKHVIHHKSGHISEYLFMIPHEATAKELLDSITEFDGDWEPSEEIKREVAEYKKLFHNDG